MTQARHLQNGPTRRDTVDTLTRWVGWVLFAGIVMVTVGVLTMIQGSVALFQDDYYVAPSGLVLEIDYSVWGWLLLGLGALVAVTGYGVLVGQTWARVVGVILIMINAVVNFMFMPAYPIWSIIAVTLNVIAIYALVAHGREARVLRR